MRDLINKITVFSFLFLNALVLLAQEGGGEAEPTTTQKIMFYGLTGAGLLLLYLSYRQSKWGRKK